MDQDILARTALAADLPSPTAAGLMMPPITPTESSERKTKWSFTRTPGRNLFSPLPQATSRQVHTGSLTILHLSCRTSPLLSPFLSHRPHHPPVRLLPSLTMLASLNLTRP